SVRASGRTTAWNLLDHGWSRPRSPRGDVSGIDEPTNRGAAMRSVTLTRKGFPFALALLAGALLYHAPGHGVTLGNIASQSGLARPLRVVIPLTLASGEALHVSCLNLVADNTSGAPQIVTGRVNVEQATTNKPRLVITTPTAVYEPAVQLSVQAGCGSTSRRD